MRDRNTPEGSPLPKGDGNFEHRIHPSARLVGVQVLRGGQVYVVPGAILQGYGGVVDR